MNIVLGGPGCGKTTYLLGRLEAELQAGVQPNEIGFVAFTRKAAHEARDRAIKRFGFAEEDLPYFRTLHSLAFRQLGLTPSDVMSGEDYATIGQALGLSFGATDSENGLPMGDSRGDQMLYLEQISRLTCQTLAATCSKHALQRYMDVRLFADTLQEYKAKRRVLDFTDMLEMFIEGGACPRLRVVFVDEAQDLSPLQWRIVERLIAHAERVYIAGDDDQAIYEWSGADVSRFLALKGNFHVLPRTHRLRRAIFDKANQVAGRIRARFAKQWEPVEDGGSISYYNEPEMVDMSAGSWLVLARNRYMLPALCAVLRDQGLPYVYNGKSSVGNTDVLALMRWEALRRGEAVTLDDAKVIYSKLRAGAVARGMKLLPGAPADELFSFQSLRDRWGLSLQSDEDWMTALSIPKPDREYYRAVRRRGESLLKHPRITVSTIHQVKGGEADHVLLKTDMAYSCFREMGKNMDGESRVFYVGLTRARFGVHVLYPSTNKFYEL